MPEYSEDHVGSQEPEQATSAQMENEVIVDGYNSGNAKQQKGIVGFVSRYMKPVFASLIVLLVASIGVYTLLGTHADAPACDQTVLKVGSTGSCVQNMQYMVNYYNDNTPPGIADAGTTGTFGSETLASVSYFQSHSNTGYPTSDFKSVGVVDLPTWKALCTPINGIGTPTTVFLTAMKTVCGNTGPYGDCYAHTYLLDSQGSCVTDIQQMINYYNANTATKLAAVKVNGVYGASTKTAVTFFQKHTNSGYSDSSFTVIGNVNTPTWNALCKPIKKVGTPTTTFLGAMMAACNTEGVDAPAAAPLAIKVSDGQLVNQNGKVIRLLGFDESGTESGCVASYPGFTGAPAGSNGSLDDSSDTPSLAVAQEEANAMEADKVNAVRIPLNEDCWLGINGATAQYSGANYQTAINDFVTALNKDNIYAILDLHWNASGSILSDFGAIGSWDMPDSSHAPTFWTQVATAYKNDPAVMFDLYNEPHLGNGSPTASDWSCWLNGCSDTYSYTDQSTNKTVNVPYTTAGMQSLINTVRATGATQPILIGGLAWSGDPCGAEDSGGNGGSCIMTNPTYEPKDTLKTPQLVVDFHNYCGASNSTTCTSGVSCDNSTCWNTDLAALKKAGLPWVTSELGEFDCSDEYMTNYENWADQSANNVSYLAWSWIYDSSLTKCYTQAQQTLAQSQNNYTENDGANITLLSNWNGTPATVAPEGAAFIQHLNSVSPY